MSISKRKHRWQYVLYSKVTLVFLLICSVFLVFSVYERYSIAREMSERRQEREREYSELETRKIDLHHKVEYLHGDHGIESELRRNFNVAKEGEEVVIIVDDEEDPIIPNVNPESDITEGTSFWSKWLPW